MTVTSFRPSAKAQAPSYQKKGLSVRAAATPAPALWIYGPIGDTSWADGFDQEDFLEAMQMVPANAKTLEIRINSEGGDAILGQAIYSVLAQHKARKTVYVDGFACSAASLIAMCGDEIRMAEGAFLMIHNARTYVSGYYGEASELDGYIAQIQKVQTLLGDVSAGYAKAYMAKCNKPVAQIQKWMNEETWFTAERAKAEGFCDVIDSRIPVAACANLAKAGYKKAPESVKAKANGDSPSSLSVLQKLRAIAHNAN